MQNESKNIFKTSICLFLQEEDIQIHSMDPLGVQVILSRGPPPIIIKWRTSEGSCCKIHCVCSKSSTLCKLGPRQSVCTACALRVHCVRTALALRAHCVHIAVNPTPCHLCIILQSNKANRTHIEPLPTRYFDVPVNISFSVVEYHYAVATTVTLLHNQRTVRAFAKDHVDPKL